MDDPRYATIENVKANHLQPELITILDEGFSKKDLEEWLKILAEWDAVSYTHLDVYKRQPMDTSSS